MSERLATMQKGLAKTEAERGEKQAELEEARSALQRDRIRMDALSPELDEVKAAIAAHKDARKRSENDKRVEAAIEDLQRLFPGVRGRLFELTTPTQKKFGTAVATALVRFDA
jgi:structural maintenance of chromosome 1